MINDHVPICTYVHVSDFACMVARSATYIYIYTYIMYLSHDSNDLDLYYQCTKARCADKKATFYGQTCRI